MVLLRSLTTLLTVFTAHASIYEERADGYCLPPSDSGYSSGYHYLLHTSLSSPLMCSEFCDESNAVYESEHPFYRGFAFVKNGGDCRCYYDAGHLPPVAGERYGDAVGDIGGGDGTDGVTCYAIIIRETARSEVFGLGLRH
eukprot:scaffold668_cov50-Cyclotella_meneghiniana.AAC.3